MNEIKTTTGFVATCQLFQEGGVQGGRKTIPTTIETAVADAIAWAEGEVGHTWDGVLVTVYDANDAGRQDPLETHQIECRDGSWECV